MRISLFVMTLAGLAATPLIAAPGDNIPMIAIGLPFDPETPEPVGIKHALYKRVEVGQIDGLPTTIKSSSLNFIAAAKRSSVNEAYRSSFAKMNLLAENTGGARFKLVAKWIGIRIPFRIATKNTASVTLHYTLSRLDSGQILFDREITTSAKGGGVDASMRDNGIVRAAIAANFASAANCLDRAAYGTAPDDCALTPKFSVSVTRY